MTTFANLQSDVFTITARPDLVNETNIAIRKATLKLHTMDYFYRDRAEVSLNSLDPTSYNQQFDIPTYFTRWRGFEYLRPVDLSGNLMPLLTRVDPQDILDSYKFQKSDIYYVGGQTLNCLFSDYRSALAIGYYQYPDTTQANYSSWIADMIPDAIVLEAASTVLTLIGQLDIVASLNNMKQEFIEIVLANGISEEGK